MNASQRLKISDTASTERRFRIAGAAVDALNIAELNAIVGETIAGGRRDVIAHHNLHSLYIWHRDPRFRGFYDLARWAFIDGMPLVWIGRLHHMPIRREHRVTYVDWFPALISEAERHNWRVFYLGSAPSVTERGAAILKGRHPALEIAVHHGYFDASPSGLENQRLVEFINRFRPHILLVGMGMPRQEIWILERLDLLATNVILTSGACMDYVAGAIPTPPRFMGRWGLEWLYRFASEPRRLWRRYLLEPLALLPAIVCDSGSVRHSKAGSHG